MKRKIHKYLWFSVLVLRKKFERADKFRHWHFLHQATVKYTNYTHDCKHSACFIYFLITMI